jgi:hypothetical protein
VKQLEMLQNYKAQLEEDKTYNEKLAYEKVLIQNGFDTAGKSLEELKSMYALNWEKIENGYSMSDLLGGSTTSGTTTPYTTPTSFESRGMAMSVGVKKTDN